MHSFTPKIFSVAALSALTAALPRAVPEHSSSANTLVPRQISLDGTCGSQSGLTCREGFCCSSLGWCGATPLHCGTGCQEEFGDCGVDDATTTITSTSTSAPSTTSASVVPTQTGLSFDGTCGSRSGLTCRPGNCCSSFGWCGAGPLYCGEGCQQGFGSCGLDEVETSSTIASASTTSASLSTSSGVSNFTSTVGAPEASTVSASVSAPLTTSSSVSNVTSTVGLPQSTTAPPVELPEPTTTAELETSSSVIETTTSPVEVPEPTTTSSVEVSSSSVVETTTGTVEVPAPTSISSIEIPTTAPVGIPELTTTSQSPTEIPSIELPEPTTTSLAETTPAPPVEVPEFTSTSLVETTTAPVGIPEPITTSESLTEISSIEIPSDISSTSTESYDSTTTAFTTTTTTTTTTPSPLPPFTLASVSTVPSSGNGLIERCETCLIEPTADLNSSSSAETSEILALETIAIPTTSASSLVETVEPITSTSAAPPAETSGTIGVDSYQTYTGNGSLAAGWPAMTAWAGFSEIWTANLPNIRESCAQYEVPLNSQLEINFLRSSILRIGTETNVDSRFILANVLQESAGCVRAPTTFSTHPNPGLMQSHDGAGTCNPADGEVVERCSYDQIELMIREGTAGTSQGDGLVQTLEQAGGDDASRYYRAARIYNSGSIAEDGDLADTLATRCYSSDIANRLTGWALAPKTCNLDGQ